MQERPKELIVNSRLRVPVAEMEFTFVRSSGPGGQNVNKVSSKAVLRWRPAASASLPEPLKARFLEKYAARLTKEGDLLLASQRYRDQQRNMDDCLARLAALLNAVATPPKKRRPTKPSRGSQERRLQEKRVASEKKQRRQGPVE